MQTGRSRETWSWAVCGALLSIASASLPERAAGAARSAVLIGPYVAASVGGSITNGYHIDGPVAHLDNTDTGFCGLVGYRFLGAFAVEVSYIDLGALTAAGPAFFGFTNELRVYGFNFGLAATYPPATSLAAQARIGAFRWTQAIDFRSPETGASVGSEGGGSFSAGVGVHYQIPGVSALGVMVDWTRYFRVGFYGKSRSPFDHDLISAGVSYSFGHARKMDGAPPAF